MTMMLHKFIKEKDKNGNMVIKKEYINENIEKNISYFWKFLSFLLKPIIKLIIFTSLLSKKSNLQ